MVVVDGGSTVPRQDEPRSSRRSSGITAIMAEDDAIGGSDAIGGRAVDMEVEWRMAHHLVRNPVPATVAEGSLEEEEEEEE